MSEHTKPCNSCGLVLPVTKFKARSSKGRQAPVELEAI